MILEYVKEAKAHGIRIVSKGKDGTFEPQEIPQLTKLGTSGRESYATNEFYLLKHLEELSDKFPNGMPVDDEERERVWKIAKDQAPKVRAIAWYILCSTEKQKTLVIMEEYGMRTLLLMLRVLSDPYETTDKTITHKQEAPDGSTKEKTESGQICPFHMLYAKSPADKRLEKNKYRTIKNKWYETLSHGALINVFNGEGGMQSRENVYGENMRVLIIQAKDYSEGISFFNVRQLVIGQIPALYPKLQQQIGRAARAFGHVELKEEERTLNIHVFAECITSSLQKKSGPTGCFLAHKSAWERIAQEPSKTIVLEQDWSIGTQDPAALGSKIEAVANSDNDYIALGHCYGRFCTHAYIMTPELANNLKDTDVCATEKAVDHFLVDQCNANARCLYVPGKNIQGLYGEGLIQQDRINHRGMHDANNRYAWNA